MGREGRYTVLGEVIMYSKWKNEDNLSLLFSPSNHCHYLVQIVSISFLDRYKVSQLLRTYYTFFILNLE